MIDLELEKEWRDVVSQVEAVFGEDLDMQAILFLIGVQELGQGYRKFTKDQKLEVIHIATCRLLSQWGYYEYIGMDKEGWPHYEMKEELPVLKSDEQQHLMKQAIVEYFRNSDLLN